MSAAASSGTGLRTRRARSVGIAAALALVAAVVGVAAARHSGIASAQVGLDPGSAWFAFPAVGDVVLVDGPTASRSERVNVAPPGEQIEVVQSGASAIVLNHTTGALRRVDGATHAVSAPIVHGSPGDAQFRVIANARTAWVLTQDATIAREIDPVTLSAKGADQSLPGRALQAALTSDGRLWVIGSDGQLRSFKDGRARSASAVDDGDVLVSSGAGVTLANPGRQRARTIGATSGKPAAASCLTVSNSPAPLVSGSSSDRSWVLAVQSSAGVLVVADTARHVCTPITLGPTSQTPRYGRPVEHAGLVFVPDITTGEIIVLDPTNATTPLRGRIYVGLVGANLSLSSTQEFAWFADAQSDVVGVIDRDLVASLLHIGGSDDAGVVPARPDEASKPPPQTRIGCVPTPTQAAAGAPVQLDAFTSDPAVVATAWVWDTGGSPPTASGSQISVSWTTPGLKAVKVIATLPTGPTTSTCTVLVTEIGIAATTSAPPTTAAQGELKAQIAYSPVPAVAGEPVEFSDRSVGQHGTTTWTFEGGEPATSADRNPKVVFSKAGLHKVGLVVGDGTVTNTTSVDVAVRQAAATTTVGGAATTAAGGGGGGGATTSTSTTTSTTTPPTTPATGVPPRTTTTVAPSTTTTSTTIPTTTTTLPPWVPDAAWTISAYPYLDAGNGNPGDTETVASNGTIVAPQFSVLFAYPPPPAYGTVIRWNAVTRSSATRTRTLTYHFSGFMGFYHVTAFVTAIVWSPITGQITEFPLLALGPEDCGACNPPSGGFNFMGSFTFAVNAGDKYGFEFGGSDSTGNSNWNTSFSVTN